MAMVLYNQNALEFFGTVPAIYVFPALANVSLICYFVGRSATCAVVLRKSAYVLSGHDIFNLFISTNFYPQL